MVTREARKKCFSNLSYFVKCDRAVFVVLVYEFCVQDVLPDDIALADATNRDTERHVPKLHSVGMVL